LPSGPQRERVPPVEGKRNMRLRAALIAGAGWAVLIAVALLSYWISELPGTDSLLVYQPGPVGDGARKHPRHVSLVFWADQTQWFLLAPLIENRSV
jgi:hypothetical protein